MIMLPGEGLPYLIGMGCSHEDDGSLLWNSPGSSRMYFPEEEVYCD